MNQSMPFARLQVDSFVIDAGRPTPQRSTIAGSP